MRPVKEIEMGRERTPVPTVVAPKSPEIANLIKDFVALHRGSAAAWCERGSAREGERAAGGGSRR
jgi:hypothetical protein